MPSKRSGASQQAGGGEKKKPTRASRSRKVGLQAADGLSGDLREFLAEHPAGWTHEDWLALLDRLRAGGHAVEDPDQIGRILEQERLVRSLGAVGGLDEQRAMRIAERYGTVWSLRQADPDEVSGAAGISREEAERIRHSL